MSTSDARASKKATHKDDSGPAATVPVKRSRLASVPLLKIFVPPAPSTPAPPTEANGSGGVAPGRAVDVPPFERSGSALRVSAGSAGRGWYAPMLTGAPSTTRQGEILNTAIIGPPTGIAGVVNGYDN
ncbi:MAG TPA: ATP/GTP-binding protein, partial [Glaciihabitans sp.]|nr:ATP/GTP-binding protein [Glaciihabitans sp.]